MTQRYEIDLKWSLWSAEREHWLDHAPDALAALEQLAVGASLTIATAPRKEIRFGTMHIARTVAGYTAQGEFYTQWDDVEDLADTLGCEPDRLYHLLDFNEVGVVGAAVDVDVQAPTLDALLRRIDQREEALLTQDADGWQSLVDYLKEEA